MTFAPLLHEAWLRRLRALRATEPRVSPRGQLTREITNAHLTIDSRYPLLDCPMRGLNYRFAVAEWLWMAFGRSDVATVAQYNKVIAQYSDDGLFLTGAYGPHIKARWPIILEKLCGDRDSRQAVIEIPRPRAATKDEPCTLSLQFLVRDRRLDLIVTMRSSDVWLGLPYDLFAFAQLQNSLAGELAVGRGWCALNAGSSHLYERNLAPATAVLDTVQATSRWLPALPGRPPAWLEEVLVKRCAHGFAGWVDEPLDPWKRYAGALLSATSAEAFQWLTATEIPAR